MSTTLAPRQSGSPAALDGLTLGTSFADALPELSLPARGRATPDPRLLVLNAQLATDLGLDTEALATARGLRLLTGEQPPAGATPVAQVYAGHQWGVFKPRLGDGRALLLGELRHADGRSRDLHLKGTGATDFSRGHDGSAAIGPMLREYLFGEAMHALGVPTTRALAVVATGATLHRDVPVPDSILPGAVLARIARSHLRIGSFEYVRAQNDLPLLRRLADHTIRTLHPQAASSAHPYRALLESVVAAHARLTADWIRIGFIHGVLSTDNVTISGETIDYGPCAFLDAYDPATWFSSLDQHGRYAYEQQPRIQEWNLTRLAEAFTPLLAEDEDEAAHVAQTIVDGYATAYHRHRTAAFRDKLGLDASIADAEITRLTEGALELLREHRVDFTGFFRDLAAAAEGVTSTVEARFAAAAPPPGTTGVDLLGLSEKLGGGQAAITDWLGDWRTHRPDPALIRRSNPVYIPRNHIVDRVLDAATEGDLAPFQRLLQAVSTPFEERAGFEDLAQPADADAPAHRTYCGT